MTLKKKYTTYNKPMLHKQFTRGKRHLHSYADLHHSHICVSKGNMHGRFVVRWNSPVLVRSVATLMTPSKARCTLVMRPMNHFILVSNVNQLANLESFAHGLLPFAALIELIPRALVSRNAVGVFLCATSGINGSQQFRLSLGSGIDINKSPTRKCLGDR